MNPKPILNFENLVVVQKFQSINKKFLVDIFFKNNNKKTVIYRYFTYLFNIILQFKRKNSKY